MDGLVNGDTQRYKDAVIAMGALMNGAFETLQSTPRGLNAPQGDSKGSQAAAVAFKMIGIGLVILCGWTVGALNEQQIGEGWQRYKAKAKEWAHEYERQFIVIKIHYLVGGPDGAWGC